MDLEKVLLILAIALVIVLLLIQLLKMQIRVATESISKETLLELVKEDSFKTLYLNSFSDTSFFKRDKVRLDVNIERVDDGEPFSNRKLFETTQEKGEILSREIGYSIYRLGKQDIDRIIKYFPGPEVAHFLFEAVSYSANDARKLIAYKIFPANQSRKKMFHDWEVIRNSLIKFPAQTSEIKKDGVDFEDLSFDSGRDYILLKPSPPASRSLD